MWQPLGESRKELIGIDTKIIRSCNTYPQKPGKENRIREDLFYRLAVVAF